MHYVGDACHETDVDTFLSPEEMYKKAFPENNEVEDALGQIPFNKSGGKEPRYYQELAVNKAISALGRGKEKILLTLARVSNIFSFPRPRALIALLTASS